MKKLSFFIALLLLVTSALFAQVSINNDGTQPDPSAGLDLKFSNKGLLIPRMTQMEIESIASPANGLMVFCTNCDKFYVFLASQNKWKEVAYGPTSISPGGDFYCGAPLTVNHFSAAGVAPVDKSVTYGTVSNIPGEPSKCWITSNLGADHQATAVNDATEPSAGWYWQFNRKQGYKHDGSVRTPITTWMTSTDENSDWQSVNDPCTLELGNGWRIPTYTEWFNIDNTGNWTDWNGPWNSALKLHTAGLIVYADGHLAAHGSIGLFWCAAQSSSTFGFGFYIDAGWSNMYSSNKADGFSLRCIRDY